jgi:hypothetical protein
MAKGKHYHNPILVENASFGDCKNNHDFLMRGQPKWPIAKKNIELWDAPTFGHPHN